MPPAAMAEAGTVAVSWVLLTKVVVAGVPFTVTTDEAVPVGRFVLLALPLIKLVPFTVIVKLLPPAVAVVGDILVVVGSAGVPVSLTSSIRFWTVALF
ncbi:hypothetical protein GCM10023184_23650 [Flaviaesturariibacter amylovorans]|uniref:Secreted peptide n=1 Tax=Flaviaesturariibacter amylovorans TaxID=1084520 RepID=A0ABP8GY01_9BACT